ncbi:MAG: tRNA preQ1(34) S-adenosylmethionine ribosyltransferase-isomerase QueA [Mycobacteriaceae bacterium]|nr:tRNA preQ1(34) S-adenosylmethionine ribosyltransferase-isomerase QueA [Mycobacteriaceae bacterium]
MRLSDFDYDLPPERIAQAPMEPRDAARLLVLERDTGAIAHRHVRDLPGLLRPGDLVVANRSRVLPARIRGRLRGGGQAELLLLRRLGDGRWEALGRPARRLRPGDELHVHDALSLRVAAAHAEGLREVQVIASAGDPDAILMAAGSTPLPPYIRGWSGDPERYQTVFADVEGSAAAPTAGLHLTDELIARLEARGIGFATVVLHVGLDTFRPVTEADPRAHHIHREWFEVPVATCERVTRTRERGGRVVAVGTTVVRTLETWATTGQVEGWTNLFILPGHQFVLIDALITNFHLPQSSLLMLVSAFAGRERVLAAYVDAIRNEYRFYSFGDAMLIN